MFYRKCIKSLGGIGGNVLSGSRFWVPETANGSSLLYIFGFNILPLRTTYILKRKYPLNLTKSNSPKIRFKPKNFVYELVENTEVRPQEKIDVILKEYVKGIGQQGDVVSVNKVRAYSELLLPGIADYVTAENIQYWSNAKKETIQETIYSSPVVEMAITYLQNMNGISIVMNKETKWTLQPWHIRVSFRKAGVHLSENCIELPPYKIEGPNLDLENKHFFVTVTINKTEKVKVKCIIHHWSTVAVDRLPYMENFWLQTQEVLPDQAQPSDTIK